MKSFFSRRCQRLGLGIESSHSHLWILGPLESGKLREAYAGQSAMQTLGGGVHGLRFKIGTASQVGALWVAEATEMDQAVIEERVSEIINM